MIEDENYEPDEVLSEKGGKYPKKFFCDCCERFQLSSLESDIDGICITCYKESLEVTEAEVE